MNRSNLSILCCVLLALTACKSKQPVAGPVEVGVAPAAVESSPMPADSAAVAATPRTVQPGAARYTLDGLIGQVNGRPIYARTILDPMHDQLARFAQQYDGKAYQDRVVAELTERVREIVQNALILGEAERDLDENEQLGLAMRLDEHRAELLRKYGRGSAAVAEQTLRDERGIGLDDAVEEERVRLVVGRYQSVKLRPQINITRRDIERYYNEHPEVFNPPVKRTVRLISVTGDADAQTVVDALASADGDFEALARSEINRFKADDGGLMEIAGESPLAVPALNERMATLAAGEHAGPFLAPNGAQWFIEVESVDQPASRSLKDAQLQVEDELFKQQFNILRARFLQSIYREGSYTPIEDMITRVYAIVEARYKGAPPR